MGTAQGYNQMTFVAAVALTAVVGTVSAGTDCVTDPQSGWTCYQVAAGDSIFSISRAKGVNPDKVCDLNINAMAGYDCSNLQIGQVLRIPNDQCSPVAGAWLCHTVQEGESLATLSTEKTGKFGVNINYIQRYNEATLWGSGNILYPGMQLKIPLYHCVPSFKWDCHTVIAGETLYTIADKYFVNAQTLADANYATVLPGGNMLYPGVQMQIPRVEPGMGSKESVVTEKNIPWGCIPRPGTSFCYKLKTNDTLSLLSSRFGVSVGELCKQLPASSVSNWKPGVETITYTAPDCSKIYDANWLSVPIKSPAGTIKTGSKCDFYPDDSNPLVRGGNQTCQSGVCLFNESAPVDFACADCDCRDLTPCRNLDATNKSRALCLPLEISAIRYNFQCPTQSVLCGEYPSKYPTITQHFHY